MIPCDVPTINLRYFEPAKVIEIVYHDYSIPNQNAKVIEKVRENLNMESTKHLEFLKLLNGKFELISESVIELLKKIEPSDVSLMITSGKSLYLIIENFELETHIEIFFELDDEDDFEAAATTYKGKKVIAENCGSIEYVFGEIENTIICPESTDEPNLSYQITATESFSANYAY